MCCNSWPYAAQRVSWYFPLAFRCITEPERLYSRPFRVISARYVRRVTADHFLPRCPTSKPRIRRSEPKTAHRNASTMVLSSLALQQHPARTVQYCVKLSRCRMNCAVQEKLVQYQVNFSKNTWEFELRQAGGPDLERYDIVVPAE